MGHQLPRSRYVANVPAPFFQVYDEEHVAQALGENTTIGVGTVPEDLWQVGGAYPFPSAAGVVTIASDSSSDTLLGTGARKVMVRGLDADWEQIEEEVDLAGLSNAVTTQEFLRINSFHATEVGSGAVNAGNITAQIAGSTVAYIEAGFGSELRAIYSTPAGRKTEIVQFVASVTEGTGNATAEIILQTRKASLGYSWVTHFMTNVANRANGNAFTFLTPIYVEEKSDIRLRVTLTTATIHIDGGFSAFSYQTI